MWRLCRNVFKEAPHVTACLFLYGEKRDIVRVNTLLESLAACVDAVLEGRHGAG